LETADIAHFLTDRLGSNLGRPSAVFDGSNRSKPLTMRCNRIPKKFARTG
jgi:hypothetical protein